MRHSKYYNIKQLKRGLLLFLMYFLHLTTYATLLSNPDDYLSANSFANHKSDLGHSTDYLLLLAKKVGVKQLLLSDYKLPLASGPEQNIPSPLPLLNSLSATPLRLADNHYKRYSRLRVFLI